LHRRSGRTGGDDSSVFLPRLSFCFPVGDYARRQQLFHSVLPARHGRTHEKRAEGTLWSNSGLRDPAFCCPAQLARTLGGAVLPGLRDMRRDSYETRGKGARVTGSGAGIGAFYSRVERYESFFVAVALAVLTAFSLLFAGREPFS